MIPQTMGRWWFARGGGCGEGFGRGRGFDHRRGGGGDDDGGGSFGARRPLRFLAHRLALDERQMAELARVLDDLKTERAQADVDERRAAAAFADGVAGDALDSARIGEAAASRVRSAERLRDAVIAALGRIHATLDAEQRQRLAFLIRTGALQL